MDNLTKLEYYRAETRHEFNLLGQRVSTSLLIKPSIDGAIAIINLWVAKEYEVLQNENLKDFKIKISYGKVSPSSRKNGEQRTDIIKRASLKFAKLLPVVFLYAWVSLCLLGVAVNLKF